MPTPILRNPYASQVKPHQKQHPVYTLYKPFYIKKKRSSVDLQGAVIAFNISSEVPSKVSLKSIKNWLGG